MLKIHQIERAIRDQLESGQGTGDYQYLGRARSVYYFRQPEVEKRDPQYRLLALHVTSEKRVMEWLWGVSYFGEVGPLAVAPMFSRWQAVPQGSRSYRSKKTARSSLESLLKMMGSTATRPFSLLRKSLADERQVGTLFSFLGSRRQQLAQEDSDAREDLKRMASPEQFPQVLALLELGDTARDDDELDLFLDSLGDAGVLQGSAGFTLDRAQALTKLSDYQLSDPVLFPLFAAAGLALGGAERIDIEIDSDETWVRFVGTNLSPHFLEEIPTGLLSPDSSPAGPALQALGRALLSGAGSDPMSFQLETPEAVLSLMDFPNAVDVVPWPRVGPQSGVFYLRRRLGWEVATRYWKSRSDPHPEIPELLSSLAYLGVPWSLNDQQHAGRLQSPTGSVIVVWRDPDVPNMAVDKPEGGFVLEQTSPIPGSVIVRMYPRMSPALIGILSGIRMEMPPHAFFATTEVLTWLPRSATDLSGLKLVGSQLFVESLEVLAELQLAAWAEFTKLFSGLEKAVKEAWVEPLLSLLARDHGVHPDLRDLSFLPRVGEEAISWNDWMTSSRRLVTLKSRGFHYPLSHGESVVVLSDVSLKLVKQMTKVEDGSSELERVARYHQRLEEWLELTTIPLEGPAVEDGLSLTWSEGTLTGWLAVVDTRKPPRQVLSRRRVLPHEPEKWAPPYVTFQLNDDALGMDLDWAKVEPESVLLGLPSVLLPKLSALADLFTEVILEAPLRREQFCYILAFLKARGKSIQRWEAIAFLPGYKHGLVSLRERPKHLTPMINEML